MDDATQTAPAATNKPFTFDDIEKKFFGSSDADLAAAGNYLGQIQSIVAADKITSNFDLADDKAFPEGYGVLVLPVKQRDEKEGKNILVSVCFAAVPTFEMAMKDEKGREYIIGNFVDAMGAKLAASVRAQAEGETAPLPKILTDFIERRTRGDSLKAFNEIKKGLVQALKSSGLKNLTAQTLRLCFMNTAIAESQFPAVSQEHWVKLLEFAAAMAVKRGLDPAVFKQWAATRDSATFAQADIDFAKLDDLLDIAA